MQRSGTEIDDVYEHLLNAADSAASAPNFLLDYFRKRKDYYQPLIESSLEDIIRKVKPRDIVKLLNLWIDMPWYIKTNNLVSHPGEVSRHYFSQENLLISSPNRLSS